MAIVVDDLTLCFESTVRTRNLLNRLVDEQLGPGDLVAILRTGGGVGALQQFTTDKRLLKAAIESLSPTSRRRGSVDAAALYREQTSTGEGPSGGSSADPAGAALAAAAASLDGLIRNMERERQLQLALGTLGALEAVVRALTPLPGRKTLLLLSEGFSRVGARNDTSRVPDRLRQLVDTANRASVVVYTLNPAGLQTLLPGAASDAGGPSDPAQARTVARELRAGLEEMAQDTGGLARFDTNDLAGALTQVLEDQKGYYLLGYEPETESARSPPTRDAERGAKARPLPERLSRWPTHPDSARAARDVVFVRRRTDRDRGGLPARPDHAPGRLHSRGPGRRHAARPQERRRRPVDRLRGGRVGPSSRLCHIAVPNLPPPERPR